MFSTFVYGGSLTFFLLIAASIWITFQKANEPGWAALLPIYNIVVLLKICGKPVWWLLLFLVPLVNLVAVFLLYVSLARSFGKSAGFGIGMILLPVIFFPLLAFSNARYEGPAG